MTFSLLLSYPPAGARQRHIPCYNVGMGTSDKMERLIRQIIALPEDDQAEVIDALLAMRAQDLGINELDDRERMLARPAGIASL